MTQRPAGGYGNVEFNGLPAKPRNGYILDGFDANDPFLGLNIRPFNEPGHRSRRFCRKRPSIPTPMRSIRDVTGLRRSTTFTKSGTNQFHGDCVRDLERIVAECDGLFSPCKRHAGNIAKKPRLHCE